jgi:hypothetical protein
MARLHSTRSTKNHSDICRTPDVSYDTTSSWPSTPELDFSSSPSPLRRNAPYSPATPSNSPLSRDTSALKQDLIHPSIPQSKLAPSTGGFPFLTPCDDPATPDNRTSAYPSRGMHGAPRKPSARSVDRQTCRARSAKSDALSLKSIPRLPRPTSPSPISLNRRQARFPASPYASSSLCKGDRYSDEDFEDIRMGRERMIALLNASASK